MTVNIIYNHQSAIVDVSETERLSRAIWLHAGVPAPHLCDGLGRCGRCRVRLEPGEHNSLPPPHPLELEVLGEKTGSGWRLACQHSVAEIQGLTVCVPSLPSNTEGEAAVAAASSKELRLAVDLGTTSIHWMFLNRDGSPVLSGQSLNPQSGAGSDVMSRLATASRPEERTALSRIALGFLRDLVHESAKIFPATSVSEICLAGNTAMTAIALNKDVAPLLAAPYSIPFSGDCTVTLPDLPPIWIPPQPAPFVGGDIAAGMAWAFSEAVPFPFLFADMGTNGECVLALDAEHALLVSVPLGPALEGIGLSCGGVAGPGSIASFSLGPGGLAASVLGGGEPQSLCGTGALSLLDTLLRAGVLSPAGTLQEPDYPLAKKLRASIRHTQSGWQLPLPDGLFFSADDVESVLKVRAAFSVALNCLLEQANMPPQAISRLLLAGSLGQHTPADLLVRLGFIPPQLAVRNSIVGNASLAGAKLFLHSPEWRTRMQAWIKGCTVLDVTSHPHFMHMFTESMRLG